jgi:hypothetical protein
LTTVSDPDDEFETQHIHLSPTIEIHYFRGGLRILRPRTPINEYILRFQQVRLISSTGEQVGT